VAKCDDLYREFLHQYSYNIDILMTLSDRKLLKQEDKDEFSKFLIRWREKATHMVDWPFEADQVRLFIRNVQCMYRQYLKFTPFNNFSLRNVGMPRK